MLSGSGAERTVRATPRPNRHGDVDVTIRVSDGANAAMDTFKVTIRTIAEPDAGLTADASVPEPVEDAGASSGGDAGYEPSSPSDDDCSCRVVGHDERPAGSLTTPLLGLLGFTTWRKRRRDKRGT